MKCDIVSGKEARRICHLITQDKPISVFVMTKSSVRNKTSSRFLYSELSQYKVARGRRCTMKV